MATLRYRGFKIQTRPYQNNQTRLWTVDFEIHRSGRRKEFSLDERYPTEREADVRCLELARLTIDGKVGGWSVHSLRPKGFLNDFREGAKVGLAGTTRTIIDLGILMVVVIGAIMLLRGAYSGH
jgi:hypothetical protein